MGKSLTDVAKQILMAESNDSAPDRDAKSTTPNKSSLKPGSKAVEAPFANPGSMAPTEKAALVDTAPVTVPGATTKKDTSGSSQSRKGAEAGEQKPVKTAGAKTSEAELMEDDATIADAEVMEEEIEISEELENFIAEKMEEGLSEEEIAAAIEENFELVSEDAKVVSEDTGYQPDMSEAIEALFAGEELSEDFKLKATTIFEAAVKAKVDEEIARIEEAYAETLEEQVQSIQEELSSNVDDYLNYVVEQWVSENEVAIEAGLRSELTEEFISGLRNLFAEHYIDIPEEKVAVVEEMTAKVEELEAKLNEEIDRNVTLSKMINESKQFEILVDACDGLTDTQAEKLKSLAEGIEFTSSDEYAQKINIIKESYFTTSVNSEKVLDNNDVEEGGMIAEEVTGRMAAYAKALGRQVPKSK
jgi:hypothetical protein